jgi:hypothetical protein
MPSLVSATGCGETVLAYAARDAIEDRDHGMTAVVAAFGGLIGVAIDTTPEPNSAGVNVVEQRPFGYRIAGPARQYARRRRHAPSRQIDRPARRGATARMPRVVREPGHPIRHGGHDGALRRTLQLSMGGRYTPGKLAHVCV